MQGFSHSWLVFPCKWYGASAVCMLSLGRHLGLSVHFKLGSSLLYCSPFLLLNFEILCISWNIDFDWCVFSKIFSGSDFLTEKPAIACSRSNLYHLHPHSGVLAELWGPRAVVWRLWLGERALGSVNEGIHPIFTVYKVNQSPIIQDPQWR